MNRVEGHDKVTGRALYAAEYPVEGICPDVGPEPIGRPAGSATVSPGWRSSPTGLPPCTGS
jgi:hypothetical protein